MKIKNIAIVLTLCFFIASLLYLNAEVKEVKFQTNLHCGSCASKIEKAVNKDSGVKKVSADVESKIVTISFDDTKTSQSSLEQRIKKIGYTVEVAKADGCCSTSASGEKCDPTKCNPEECSHKKASAKSDEYYECCSGKLHKK